MFVLRDPDNVFDILNNNSGGTTNFRLTTTAVYRDYSSWMHVLLAIDTTQATASNRAKLYVNGTQVTAFSTATYPSQNTDLDCNGAIVHNIGREAARSNYYTNAYLADIYFIDGQALDPSSFTETDATTGQLVPKAFSGSYGTNGWHLDFADNSAATATTLGKDTSGNGNNWTPNNLSVTAGAGNDSLVDSPTNYGTDTGVGGEVRGNYATSNPLDNGGQTLANGNLDITGIASNWRGTRGTIGMSSGKWYWEVTISFTNSGSNQSLLGIATNAASISGNYASAGAYGWEYYSNNGNKFNNGSNPSYGAAYTSGDVIGIAFDADSGSLTFYKNGSSQGTAYTGLTSGPYFPSFSLFGTSLVSFNGGQRAFAYTAPSGYKALCTQNLPAPLVTKSNTVMDVVLYTGDGGTQTVSGLAFGPDFVWTKVRNIGYGHRVWDTVRGATKRLETHDTTAEVTETTALTAFNSDGFTVGSEANVNQSGRPYVAWAWDAGTSTVANNSGSISSQVRANATAGFSVVNVPGYTYPTKTAGHGLGVEPHFIITKSRGVSNPWIIYHKSAGANTYFQFDTGAGYTGVAGVWSGVTSTVFPLNSGVNQQTDIVAYCFAPVVGYSSFGTYTGNGSGSDGPFVYTGFRPRFLMVKRTDNTANWFVLDTARNTYNAVNSYLMPNSSSAEDSNNSTVNTDFLSNGFKLRATTDALNTSSATYIYAAFAESPFNYSRAR